MRHLHCSFAMVARYAKKFDWANELGVREVRERRDPRVHQRPHTRRVRKLSGNCRFAGRNFDYFDLRRPPGNELLKCTWVFGRDIVMEGQLTTLLQTADRMWATCFLSSLCFFFFIGHRWVL